MAEFTSNQSFITSNFKDFSLQILEIVMQELSIRPSSCHKSLFIVVEVGLQYIAFILFDEALNICNLFHRVKVMSFNKIFMHLCSCFASLTVIECETKCYKIIPPNLCHSQVSEFLSSFACKFWHVRNWIRAFQSFNCNYCNELATPCDWLEHQTLSCNL